jgi:uncharacterized metal-binding protein
MKNENQNNSHKITVVPCSGIGKTYGTVSRLAAYELVDDLCSDSTQLVPLSLLVLGDEETRAKIEANQVITIDGCKLACAKNMVAECGGEVIQDFSVLDTYRRYKQYKPAGISELNEGGCNLANALAKEVAQVVSQLMDEKGGSHG